MTLGTADLVLVLWLFIPFLSYFLYWYEFASCDERYKLQGPHLLRVAFGFLTSVASIPLLVLTYPMGFFHSWLEWQGSERPKAIVVCIHGLFHNPSAWIFYRFLLPKKGFHMKVLYHFPWEKDFVTVTRRMVETLTMELPNDETPIILLGHSLGGVIAGLAGRELHDAGFNVRGVIAMGAPFYGSKLTAFVYFALAKSIGFKSELLSEARDKMSNPPFKAMQLWSPVDNMVLPLSSLYRVPQGWALERTFPVSHAAVLYWPSVIKQAMAFIDKAL